MNDIRHIIDLAQASPTQSEQAAHLLYVGFQGTGTDFAATRAAAQAEVAAFREPERIARLALNSQGQVVGWIGGLLEGYPYGWELHPLVVDPAHQRQGIGRALVADLIAQVRQRGGTMIWLGTDDENGRTSLGGIDLYPDPLQHLARIQNIGDHPFEFYRKQGFVLAGVLPDANGFGKPDILMVRRVEHEEGANDALL